MKERSVKKDSYVDVTIYKNRVNVHKNPQVYKTKDLVVGTLDLKTPTSISISITDKEVSLQIGPRDIQWDRKSKKVVSSGCLIGN